MFTYDEIIAIDKTSLNIIWLKDKSLADLDHLPDPDELALEITREFLALLVFASVPSLRVVTNDRSETHQFKLMQLR